MVTPRTPRRPLLTAHILAAATRCLALLARRQCQVDATAQAVAREARR